MNEIKYNDENGNPLNAVATTILPETIEIRTILHCAEKGTPIHPNAILDKDFTLPPIALGVDIQDEGFTLQRRVSAYREEFSEKDVWHRIYTINKTREAADEQA